MSFFIFRGYNLNRSDDWQQEFANCISVLLVLPPAWCCGLPLPRDPQRDRDHTDSQSLEWAIYQ